MVLDSKNACLYIATTEADRLALVEWAGQYPTLHAIDRVDPLHAHYKHITVTRPTGERYALGLRSLIHTQAGRRFANRYHLASFDDALDLLGRYPDLREGLLDFCAVGPQSACPVTEFADLCEHHGYATAPSFPTVEPVVVTSDFTPKRTNNRIGIYYINVDGDKDRAAATETGLAALGWSALRVSATTPTTAALDAILPDYEAQTHKRQIEYALSISHLRCLDRIAHGSEGWGLVLEDDIDLDAAKQWGFDLAEIPARLPPDCGVFQMQITWPILAMQGNRVTLRAKDTLAMQPYWPNQYWGTAAYLVRREYAAEVVRKMRRGEMYDFRNYPGMPVSDVWLYDATWWSPSYKVYSAPLLYSRGAGSSINDGDGRAILDQASRQFTVALHAKTGTIQADEVFKPVEPKDYPFVTIVTPTYNRRHLLPLLEQCILRQTYPRCRMEWLIVDDSQDGQPRFKPGNHGVVTRYIVLPDKMTLGAKRNYTLEQARGQICVYMDDDDYYAPTRVAHAVETLQKHPEVHAVGTTYMPIYYVDTQEFVLVGPWGQQHTTAGSLAHRRILAETQRFDASATYSEEPSFLDRYKIPLVQLNPYQTMTCIAHASNTYDKKRVLGTNKVAKSEVSIDQVIPADLHAAYRMMHGGK